MALVKRHLWAGFLPAFMLTGAADAGPTLNDRTSVQIVGNLPFENQLSAARALGIRKVRLAVYWSTVERPRGRFTWRPSDDRVNAVLRAGMVPIIVLFGGNEGYPAAEGVVRGAPSTEEAVAGFARFGAGVAARYGAGTADAPILYEIWNEPNTKTFWGRPPQPEAYARMAEQTCLAIKAATPQAKVIALGMEGTPVKAPYFVRAYNIDIYQQWAGRAATPALMRCADGISMHPYLPTPEQYLADEPKLRAFVAGHWAKPVPPIIVNTEWGYTIDAKRGRTAAGQAAIDLRALLIGAGMGRVTNLYQSVDGGRDPSKPDQTFGLVTSTGQIKPAGLAVQRLLRIIGDFEIDRVSAIAKSPGLYLFEAHRGAARARIFWSTQATTKHPVPAGARALDLVSGEVVPINAGTVQIAGSPILVSWSE